MRLKNASLSGAAVLAGTLLCASAAFSQETPAPSPNAPSQPAAAQPGSEGQPSGMMNQNTPATATPGATSTSPGSQQMSSPQSTSSTMSASAGEPLTKVKDAKTTLASASVQDSTGQPVGQVANVHTTKRGTPTTIDVTLQSGGQSKTIAIKASSLRYDASSNTLKTDLTSSDLQSMPSASGT
jgi:hypothetical protein